MKRRPTEGERRRRVQGRDAIRTAVIDAARDLFSEKGYAAVSVREIADKAGVNHGLIHRHFGAKEAVLHAVLQGMFEDVDALARLKLDPAQPDFIVRIYPLVAARKRDWQILMRAVLDGFDFQQAGFRYPLTHAMLAHTSAMRGRKDRQARILAGAVIAGGLGWLLLEDYLSPILQLEGVSRETLRTRVSELFQAFTVQSQA